MNASTNVDIIYEVTFEKHSRTLKKGGEEMVIEYCPHCGWRLFDIALNSIVFIEIKCPRCKQLVTVEKTV